MIQTSSEPASAPAPRHSKKAVGKLGVPPGHLPRAGQCRVWVPGKPPGHQAKPRPCRGIERDAPAGSWILYRPTDDEHVVHVREVDERRAGVVLQVRVYDADRGVYLRDD